MYNAENQYFRDDSVYHWWSSRAKPVRIIAIYVGTGLVDIRVGMEVWWSWNLHLHISYQWLYFSSASIQRQHQEALSIPPANR